MLIFYQKSVVGKTVKRQPTGKYVLCDMGYFEYSNSANFLPGHGGAIMITIEPLLKSGNSGKYGLQNTAIWVLVLTLCRI